MGKSEKKLTNPASSGSLGGIFETRVQAAFAVYMLTGRVAPCLPPWPIQKIKLQGKYAGFNTDDFIVFTKEMASDNEAKLFAQIKRSIKISDSDEIFQEVIQAAWNDFNNADLFKIGNDSFALITVAPDIDVRTILDWARHSEDETEFFYKVNLVDFSSKRKKKILTTFRTQLQKANNDIALSDRQLWVFLKHFHLLGYDLDSDSSSIEPILLSLIAKYSDDNPSSLWEKLISEIQSFNPDAGTFSFTTISSELRDSFDTKKTPSFIQDLKKLNDHSKYIIEGIKSHIGGFHIKRPGQLAKLIKVSEEQNFVIILGDRGCGKSSVVREFSGALDGKESIFCLRTEDLDNPHLDNIFSSMGLTSSIGDLAEGLALIPKKYLLIESLEKLLELHNETAFDDLLRFLIQHPSWTIIATCRNYAYQQISFRFLQPLTIRYDTITIEEFSDADVQQLGDKFELLKPLLNNPSLKQLIKNPFIADLAYRVATSGQKFSADNSEREFRDTIWKIVILKEWDRTDGMPVKRRRTFIDVAVRRAKHMIYEVSDDGFDPGALLKLESDNLICRNAVKSRVRPDHDVLEDWAIVEYIEEKYLSSPDDPKSFLISIGHEPAMHRAFRLWLNQKIKDGDDIRDLILSIIDNEEIERIWQDETITSILQGDNPSDFFSELKDHLFEKDGELLKRFCFILRISCKIPNQKLVKRLAQTNDIIGDLHYTLFLKPYGHGWDAIIHFLFSEKQHLSQSLLPHITAILEEWASQIDITEDLPTCARDAGLLSLYLLKDIKDSYKHESERKKLLGVIIRVVPSIQNEFNEMLDTDLFQNNTKNRRLYYIEELVDLSLSERDTMFLCKHIPDTVINIAWHEWITDDTEKDEDEFRYGYRDADECFGLNSRKTDMDFFPPSGEKGPFSFLLLFHPHKGLNFILGLLNTTAEKYAHSEFDSPEKYPTLPDEMAPSGVQEVELTLNDETKIKQYCSERLWFGYRGHEVIPNVLQCALMALENWLIEIVTIFDDPAICQGFFNKILRRSNSVMPTAILASIATGFPDKLGMVALPILRTPEFYDLDLKRNTRERGEHEANLFDSRIDPLAGLYKNERRKSALHPWRKKDLEWLILQLQLTSNRTSILTAIDELQSKAEKNETWRFRLHRIDSRDMMPEIDEEKHMIALTPQHIEQDLLDIQEETQKKLSLDNRFYSIFFWADKMLKNEPLDREYYSTWQDAFEETKNLLELIESAVDDNSLVNLSQSALLSSGGLTKAAALFIRDHHSEIEREKISWCISLVITAILTHADSRNPAVTADISDSNGSAAAASVLPIIFDFASNADEIRTIKQIHSIALTHVNENVRFEAANGIRNYLWQRDREFAQTLFTGTIQYSERIALERKKDPWATKSGSWVNDFRNDLTQGTEYSVDIDHIAFQSYHPGYLLSSCLMIPIGSAEPNQIKFLSHMFTLFTNAEKDEYSKHSDSKDENIKFDFKISMKFGELFANHLFYTSDTTVQNILIENVKVGCKNAPELTNWIFLFMEAALEKTGKLDRFWWFWNELSKDMQKIAIDTVEEKSRYKKCDENQRKLIRTMLFASIKSQYVNNERNKMVIGKKSIENFVVNAGLNPDVFEAMTTLMYYYPDLFFESGLRILSKHQKSMGGTQLFTRNAAFNLERCINRFFYGSASPISKELFKSCQILLDALVDTGSSGAYYLREYLIQSRRVAT